MEKVPLRIYQGDILGHYFEVPNTINSLHPNIEFTMQMERKGQVPFLGLMLTKK